MPQSWKLATVGELYKIVSGGTPSTKNEKYWGGDIPWITSANIHGLKDIQPERTVTQLGIENSATNLVPKGSIIVVTRVSLGKVALADTDICFSQDSQALLPNNDVLPEYALYYLSWAAREFKSKSRGTTISGITKKQLETLEFPLPPLPEQERIVAKLEETFTQLEAGVAELQNAKAQLKRYRAAVLKSAVEGELTREWREAHQDEIEPAKTLLSRILEERRKKWEAEGGKGKYKEPATPHTDDLPELPEGWAWASLEQSASFEPRSIQSGPFGSSLLHSEFQETGILAIGIDNVLDGKFSMGKQHRISQKKYGELEKYTARPLDVLITVMATVGRCCVVPADLETAIITKHVYRISANQKLVNSYFLMYCLLAESVTRHQIFGGVRGQTRPGINKSVLVNLEIPIPPLREQERIVEKIERRMSVADEIEKELDESLVRAERLRGSVLKNAFEGKL